MYRYVVVATKTVVRVTPYEVVHWKTCDKDMQRLPAVETASTSATAGCR
jgi:hypothetical protein